MKSGKDIFIIFLCILILAVCIFVASYVMKYKEIYETDPLIYGVKKRGISQCTCFAEEGGSTLIVTPEKITINRVARSPYSSSSAEEIAEALEKMSK